MKRKIFLLSLVGIFALVFGGNFCFAAPSIVPRTSPTDGATDVGVDSYFKWQHVGGATSYVLRIKRKDPDTGACNVGFSSDEDSIPPPAGALPGDEVSMAFLDLSIGTIDYADTYCWKVRADFEGGAVFDDTPWWTFETEPEPMLCGNGVVDSGEECDDGNTVSGDGCSSICQIEGEGGAGEGGGVTELLKPIGAESLEELLNTLINFLFWLALAVAPVLLIIGAINLISGQPERINRGKKIIMWTLIAVTIVVLAKGLPAVIKAALGG